MVRLINVETINNALINNREKCEKVLNKIGCKDIKYNESQHLLYCPRPEGDNPRGILTYIDSCRVIGTTDSSITGNVITLVMHYKDCNFPRALDLIAGWLGIKEDKFKLKYPFGHFYKDIVSFLRGELIDQNVYDESILEQYSGLSKKFLDDGVSLLTQEKFEIGFSHEDNGIAIPIRDINGSLVGVKIRNNDDSDFHNRFWSTYKYQKNLNVYGLYQNYSTIIKKNRMIICEAEKSVMQADSFGCNIVVAIGGHSISQQQAQLIKSCLVNEIIVAFDTDICFDEAKYEAKKLIVNNSILTNKVGVLKYSKSDKLGDKSSPTDYGREVFKECMKEVVWIGER